MRTKSCAFLLSASLLVFFAACGGGSNNNNNSPVYPVPGITALSPASVTAGAAAQTLTITGTNFPFLLDGDLQRRGAHRYLCKRDRVDDPTRRLGPSHGGNLRRRGDQSIPRRGRVEFRELDGEQSYTHRYDTVSIVRKRRSGGADFDNQWDELCSSSTVTYNAAAHTATYVSATQLTIRLSAGDQAASGTFAVVVTNPTPGGGSSNSVNFTMDNPVPTLASLSPASATAGAAAQTLTINGTNFFPRLQWLTTRRHTPKVCECDPIDHSTERCGPSHGGNLHGRSHQPGARRRIIEVRDLHGQQPGAHDLEPVSDFCHGGGRRPNSDDQRDRLCVHLERDLQRGGAHSETIELDAIDDYAKCERPGHGGNVPCGRDQPGAGWGASNAVNFTVSSANNPVPVISSLSPSSANAGAAAQTLAIAGTGFISASTVTYNRAAHSATFVSSTRLTITLSVSDQATAGSYPVVVTNPAPGRGASNAVNFTVNSVANNPLPVISSLSPSSAAAGAAAQTLTINGTGFISTSTVTYNGASHTAIFVGSTQLTITLSPSDQATAGSYPVVVTNPAPGGGASNAVDFTVNAPVNNVLSLDVNLGPKNYYINGLFASVEVCEPGSTTNCTTVPDVIVDTGSVGLRLLSGAVSGLTLPAVTDSSGNDVQECIQFISTAYIWGPGCRSGY